MWFFSPVSYVLLWVLLSEGTTTDKKMIQLRRGKRDTDILAACDDRCIPEDQVTDYDLLLEYDDDDNPGSSSSEDKKKPCVYACKIVNMNNTEGSLENESKDFSITSVEDLGNSLKGSSDEFSDFLKFKSIVGKNMSFWLSSTTIASTQKTVTIHNIVNENATIEIGLKSGSFGKSDTTEKPDSTTTSTTKCACSENNTSPSASVSSPIPSSATENATDSPKNLTTSSESFLDFQPQFIKTNSSEADMLKDQNKSTTDKTTPLLQPYTAIPVIPKVIRLTVVEAEMAEAGAIDSSAKTTGLQNSITPSTSSVALNSSTYNIFEQDFESKTSSERTEELRNHSTRPSVDQSAISTTFSRKVTDTTAVQVTTTPSLPKAASSEQIDKIVGSVSFTVGFKPGHELHLQVAAHGPIPSTETNSVISSTPLNIIKDSNNLNQTAALTTITTTSLPETTTAPDGIVENQSSSKMNKDNKNSEGQEYTTKNTLQVTTPKDIPSQEPSSNQQLDKSLTSVPSSSGSQLNNDLQLSLLNLLKQFATLTTTTTTSLPVTTTASDVTLGNLYHSLSSNEVNNANKNNGGQEYTNTVRTPYQVITPQNIPSQEPTSIQQIDQRLTSVAASSGSQLDSEVQSQRNDISSLPLFVAKDSNPFGQTAALIMTTTTLLPVSDVTLASLDHSHSSNDTNKFKTRSKDQEYTTVTTKQESTPPTQQNLPSQDKPKELLQSTLPESSSEISLISTNEITSTIFTPSTDSLGYKSNTSQTLSNEKMIPEMLLSSSNQSEEQNGNKNSEAHKHDEKTIKEQNSTAQVDNCTSLNLTGESCKQFENSKLEIRDHAVNNNSMKNSTSTDTENANITDGGSYSSVNSTADLANEAKINSDGSENSSQINKTDNGIENATLPQLPDSSNASNLTEIELKNSSLVEVSQAQYNESSNPNGLNLSDASSAVFKNLTGLNLTAPSVSEKHEPILIAIDLQNIKKKPTNDSNSTVNMTSPSLELKNGTLLNLSNNTELPANHTTTLRKI